MRHLIKPPPGWGVAYVDWSAQEIAIAAGLSGDEHLLADYATGDIYLNLAIRLGLAPAGASKATHPEPRARCKVVKSSHKARPLRPFSRSRAGSPAPSPRSFGLGPE